MNIGTRALFVFVIVGVVVGLAAGIIGTHVIGSHVSVLRSLVSGLIGAFVGGGLFEALNFDLSVSNRLLLEITTAAVGALIVVIPAQFIG